MSTAIVHDSRFLNHLTGDGHPERPARLSAALDALAGQAWFGALQRVAATAIDPDWVDLVHDPRYRERALKSCADGMEYLDSPDVAVCPDSGQVAMLAAGAVLNSVDAVMSGEVDNAFVLARPPGHHAEHSLALGFCLFNNIAIAARYLQRRHDLDKVLILDWDVHHGNGTQHLFEEDPSVAYISLHQYPHYPGTGAWSETGSGAGSGATLNCPMSAGSGEHEYVQAFDQLILPAIDKFAPDAILLSSGFDAHVRDPLGDINLSTQFYAWMTQRMMECADRHCEGRLVSVLEGGYDLDALAASVVTHVGVLSGNDSSVKPDPAATTPR